jgi:hypothetical protein
MGQDLKWYRSRKAVVDISGLKFTPAQYRHQASGDRRC